MDAAKKPFTHKSFVIRFPNRQVTVETVSATYSGGDKNTIHFFRQQILITFTLANDLRTGNKVNCRVKIYYLANTARTGPNSVIGHFAWWTVQQPSLDYDIMHIRRYVSKEIHELINKRIHNISINIITTCQQQIL